MKELSPLSTGAIAKAGSNRRSFLKRGMAAGALSVGAGLLSSGSRVFADSDGDQDRNGRLHRGDAAILVDCGQSPVVGRPIDAAGIEGQAPRNSRAQ